MEGKKQLEQARERIIEAIAQNIDLYGLTHSAGRLYGTMFFHNKPLTLDEMKEELGMSKTSMSTTVRALSDIKQVEKVWKKGVRKDLYQIEEDWYQSFIDLFSIKWRNAITMHLTVLKKSLADLRELVEDGNTHEEIKKLAKIDIEKLEYAYDYYQWLHRLVEAFENHDIFKLVPKTSNKSTHLM
ncbi:DNA-binding transcriptional regulator GbsR (MarR family) [Bacillus thermophilus]|uniref:HTH-type transcriptional regulator n=1 Tax=Siminovitchia thermophila TaxID=1245522 RepID=A0ABS2R821_9BACI|nr:DNA-binding transcriptional regulator GbsR (MarR family) [Siminovitchia thermophila]